MTKYVVTTYVITCYENAILSLTKLSNLVMNFSVEKKSSNRFKPKLIKKD